MAPPKGPRKILRAAAPPERARVPGVAVPDAAPDRRDAGIQRVEDPFFSLCRVGLEKTPSTASMPPISPASAPGVQCRAHSGGGGRTISRFRKKWKHLF